MNQVLHGEIVSRDFISVWLLISMQYGGESRTKPDISLRLHPAILNSDSLDLNDSASLVDDKAVFASLSVVDPAGKRYSVC